MRRALAGLALCLACAPAERASPVVTVSATDYAFQVPDTLPPGTTRFQFANLGRVPHEMAFARTHAGVTADSVLAYAAAGRDPGDLVDVIGILIVNPGDTAIGSLTADLLPGRDYLMICTFQDADSLPPHLAMGMHASFVVK